MNTLYSQALGTGYEAAQTGIRRQSQEELWNLKNRQRGRTFGMLSNVLMLGSSIWQNWQSNKDLMDWAATKGYKTTTSPFTNIFGSSKFNVGGKEVGREFMLTMQMYEDYYKRKQALDEMGGQ